MSLGKYTSLEEARKKNKLDRFIHDNPSQGDKQQLTSLITAMANGVPRKKPEGGKK
jgi:hypothetical protein